MRYLASVLIWQFLNPFGFWQSVLQNVGQVIAILRSRVSKIAAPEVAMSLPFSGYWTVVNGGVDKTNSHSWTLIGQRYAYDFVLFDKDGKRYEGDARETENYYSYGREVLAPADGTVVGVRHNVRDHAHAGTGAIDILTRDLRGNYVIIRHASNTYSFIAHLKKDSCPVKPGDFVRRGQVIGRCGNSGHSTEPHVHFHVQDRPNFYLSIGLPIPFENVEVKSTASEATERLESGYISRNRRVRNLTPDEKMRLESHDRMIPARAGLFSLFTSAMNVLGLIVWLFIVGFSLIRII